MYRGTIRLPDRPTSGVTSPTIIIINSNNNNNYNKKKKIIIIKKIGRKKGGRFSPPPPSGSATTIAHVFTITLLVISMNLFSFHTFTGIIDNDFSSLVVNWDNIGIRITCLYLSPHPRVIIILLLFFFSFFLGGGEGCTSQYTQTLTNLSHYQACLCLINKIELWINDYFLFISEWRRTLSDILWMSYGHI